MKNSLSKGRVRTIVFKDKGVWYGVALEFNIVESGDNPREVSILLDDAIKGYVESAIKIKNTSVLNQSASEEYEKMWRMATGDKVTKSPYSIYSAGSLELSALKYA